MLLVEVEGSVFVYLGGLYIIVDFIWIKICLVVMDQFWIVGWQCFIGNCYVGFDWQLVVVLVIYCGKDGVGYVENYSCFFNDVVVVYVLVLCWKISGDDCYVVCVVFLFDVWVSILQVIEGSLDCFLVLGIYGYQLVNVGEFLCDYLYWFGGGFNVFKDMMLWVFYLMNYDFFICYNGVCIDYYWVNWDFVNMSLMMVIGILVDCYDFYQEVVCYFKQGVGNGVINNLVWMFYFDGFGQIQESGCDQGYSLLDLVFVGVFCQMVWNQGDDLFGYENNWLLCGVEYVVCYNLGDIVFFMFYYNSDVMQEIILFVG